MRDELRAALAPEVHMSDVTLNEVMAMNDELASFAELGIPSHLASDKQTEDIRDTLQNINVSLSLRSSLGQTLEAAVAENSDLPPAYRNALLAGLQSDNLSATLDGIDRRPAADGAVRNTLGRSLVSPLILLVLGFFAFIFLCLFVSPALERMYEQVGETPSGPVSFLVLMRNGLPYWAVLVPLLIVAAVVCWRRGWGGGYRLLPGARNYAKAVRNANFCSQMAWLLDSGATLKESLPVAAGVTGDREFIAACEAVSREGEADTHSEALRPLPPLLRWALTEELGNQSLPEILRFAESAYRRSAERRAATWQVALPTIIGAALGGAIVLAYGLSVFGPIVRLLDDLSS